MGCIVGHFTKTMMLFMLPQWLNFLYSCPQLFKFLGIPIPRHRMPAYDAQRGMVQNSFVKFRVEELNCVGQSIFWFLKTFRLAKIKLAEDGKVAMSNLTIINFVLYVFGPCRED